MYSSSSSNTKYAHTIIQYGSISRAVLHICITWTIKTVVIVLRLALALYSPVYSSVHYGVVSNLSYNTEEVVLLRGRCKNVNHN